MLRGRWRRSDAEATLPPPRTTDVAETFPWCLAQGIDTRPQYLWGVLLAARQARALGLPRITAIEFGVAGGNGLLALERAAAAAGELLGVQFDVLGFDSGVGMPPSEDPRDVPWLIEPGWFAMDEKALRARLTGAELLLGPVGETVPQFVTGQHAPVGFVAFDLDYYTATVEALRVLEAAPDRILPRVVCYFDDVFGYGWSEWNGERAAIAEFNSRYPQRKLGQIPGLRYSLPRSQFELPWTEQMYLSHAFDHPGYSTPEGALAEGWLAAHRLSR